MKQKSTPLGDLFTQHPAFVSYLQSIAGVLRALGTDGFEAKLIAFLSEVVPVDNCAVFTYSDKGEAGHLFTHGRMPEQEAEKLARQYVDRFHEEDPNYIAMQNMGDQDYYGFGQLSLKADYDPAYNNQFFSRSGLIDKASAVGKIEDGKVYCNFYRMDNSSVYSPEERQVLEDIMPLATALAGAHYDLSRAKGSLFADNGSENIVKKSIVHNVISKDAPPFDVLTKREREVCERILLGYTTIGMGLDLSIAPTSVATYRKRAYAKLGISSQNELFSLCLKAAKY